MPIFSQLTTTVSQTRATETTSLLGSYIEGTLGEDIIYGTAFNDYIDGSSGSDYLFGGAGADTLSGGKGWDMLVGGSGDDTLMGGLGNDILAGGSGNDTLMGGGGDDTFVYGSGDGTDTITDFKTVYGDKVDLTGVAGTYSLADLTIAQDGADTVISFADGGALILKDVASETLTDDEFLFQQAETPVNQAPTDIALSNAAVEENSAVDMVIGSLSASDPDADETFTYSLLDDAGGRFAIVGDTIVVAGDLDYETSATYDVTVRTTDSGGNVFDKTFTIDVTDVDDAATPDEGAAGILLGGDGMDTLVSALGSDVMTGGADADMFVFQAIQSQAGDIDTITDFVVGQDFLQLDGLAVVEQAEFDLDGDAVLDTSLTLDNGAIIQLMGVSNVSQWDLMQ